jgi:glycosyltransferase involved in cell wall biosynthesis
MSNEIRELNIGAKMPHETPAVTIIIPNYNTAKFIAETLDSVFAQTLNDFEVIVINDGSPDTDELLEVLEHYRERVVFIDMAENQGTSATRNFAAEHARADILAFLDADDVWRPTFLEELLAFKRAGAYEMAYADAETFGIKNAVGRDFLSANPDQGEITRKLLIGGKCHILPSGSFIDARVFREAGGFDPRVVRTEDFDLWMRFVFAGVRIGYLRKLLFSFRIRPASGSGDSIQRIQRCRDVWRILQDKLPFTDEENDVIERHVATEQAALLRAEGRYAVSRRDWTTAREKFGGAFRAARALRLPVLHRVKMLVVWLLLYVWPGLVLRVQTRTRPDELALMPVTPA